MRDPRIPGRCGAAELLPDLPLDLVELLIDEGLVRVQVDSGHAHVLEERPLLLHEVGVDVIRMELGHEGREPEPGGGRVRVLHRDDVFACKRLVDAPVAVGPRLRLHIPGHVGLDDGGLREGKRPDLPGESESVPREIPGAETADLHANHGLVPEHHLRHDVVRSADEVEERMARHLALFHSHVLEEEGALGLRLELLRSHVDRHRVEDLPASVSPKGEHLDRSHGDGLGDLVDRGIDP